VIVNWGEGSNPGKIWVTEKSVTNEAVCFGSSDTLNIIVFKDPAAINLDYVSIDELNEERIHLQASTTYSNRIKELRVFSKREDADTWQDMGNVPAAPQVGFDMDNFETDTYSYQFRVDMINKCDQQRSSNVHNSILLAASANEAESIIDLNWRKYNFWTAGNVGYELLTSLTSLNGYGLAETVVNDTISTIHADDSFFYFVRVKAICNDGLFTSLSNEVKVAFNRELVIPNVITPNNDGYNDTFEIKNIKLFPQNRLVIVNRYGKTLLDQSGYKGGWSADEVPSGTYYFNLFVPEKQQEYKGWLQVIR
jgi:gliding motility-associated-like protein